MAMVGMTALDRLAERIRHGRAAGLLSEEWERDIETALAELRAAWLPEHSFRALTGASASWCVRRFAECERLGLARRGARGERIWHRHARRPKTGADPERLAEMIAEDFGP
ncbi:MAG TPA: hypothetical protein VNL18_16265 [Gemmatimonadales bacterium]|nr:hypothetical protein [Gemmatimonadales bacterium]